MIPDDLQMFADIVNTAMDSPSELDAVLDVYGEESFRCRSLQGEDPIHFVLLEGDVGAAKRLLDVGFVLDGVNKSGGHVLALSAELGLMDSVRFLLDLGVSKDRTDEFGFTGCQLAREAGYDFLASILEPKKGQHRTPPS